MISSVLFPRMTFSRSLVIAFRNCKQLGLENEKSLREINRSGLTVKPSINLCCKIDFSVNFFRRIVRVNCAFLVLPSLAHSAVTLY